MDDIIHTPYRELMNSMQIWRHIQPDTMPSAEVTCELHEGQGQLRLRLEFDPEPLTARPRASLSFSSLVPQAQTGSALPTVPISPSRFSLSSRKTRQD